MAVTVATVADGLRSAATRVAALDVLDALAPPIPSAVALTAAPALVDTMATETERASFDRCGLMLARLLTEAAPDPAAVYGAATGGERLATIFAPALLVEAVQRASSGQPLTREDAWSYACPFARDPPAWGRGCTAPEAAAGRTVTEYWGTVSLTRPLFLPRAHPVVALSAACADDECGAAFISKEDARR